jgi:dTDP-4-amino-4,6-dideoxygalactose transaminase
VSESPELIPFNRTAFVGREREYLEQALSNLHISSDGPFSKRAADLLARELGAPRALLTTSCTDALEMTALLLDLQPGDEVVMPSFTFVSTANAYALRGARPVFVDIREDTWNIDERLIEAAITPRTRALVVVHYAGQACEMEPIVALTRRYGLQLIEDNAHGLFGQYRGKQLGTFGAMATLSFHETKNFSCGEGGALVINDPALVERAEILHAKGTNRSRFLRGQVDKYTWVDVGSSYGLSDLLAAVLFAQLERKAAVTHHRRGLYERYLAALTPMAARCGWRMPIITTDRDSAYHMFPMLLTSIEERDALIRALRARNILAVFHYVPLHDSEMGGRLGYRPGMLPVSEDVSRRLVRLPFFNTMTWEQQGTVIDAIKTFAG